MVFFLRQSTAIEIPLGPFLDDIDGKTAETALTISQADVRLKKNEGLWAQKNDANAATHEENGWYKVPLNSTDTGTLGLLVVAVHEAGALPVWRDFMVIPDNIYLSYFSTDKFEVDVVQIQGSTVNTNAAQLGVNVVNIASTPQSAADLAARIGVPAGASISADIAGVQSDTNDMQTRLPAALVSGRMDASVGAMAAGVVTASAVATGAIDADALATDAVAEIADGVWDEAIAGHLGAGSTGEKLNSAGSAGDPWATALPGAYGAGTAGNIVGNNLDATVSSRSTLDAAGVRTAVGLASANLDTQLDALPTANENADALLKRDWTSVTGEAARSVLNALRFLRNKWSISGTTLTVTKEDDATSAWTSALTTAPGADPVSGSDPA